MNNFQSAGGVARGKIQREDALSLYYAKPNICLHCFSAIKVLDNSTVAETKRKKFCNRSCSTSYNNIKFPKREAIIVCEVKCLLCDNKISLKKKESGGFYNRVLCDQCLVVHRVSSLRKSDYSFEDLLQNQTKQSLYDRTKNWQSANSMLREHSRKIYFKSNFPKSCKVCLYDKHIEICHIKSIKDFSDDSKVSEINCIENLVALCRNHHWELDNNLLGGIMVEEIPYWYDDIQEGYPLNDENVMSHWKKMYPDMVFPVIVKNIHKDKQRFSAGIGAQSKEYYPITVEDANGKEFELDTFSLMRTEYVLEAQDKYQED